MISHPSDRIPSRFSRYAKVAATAALKAGHIIAHQYTKAHTTSYKKDGSIVTDADLAAKRAILSVLTKQFPSHNVYSEEAGINWRQSPYIWTVDPLDGTTNYTIKNPFFNTTISLSKNDVPIMGVIYSPLFDELLIAERGKGAYLNGKRIRVSNRTDPKNAVIGHCHGSANKATIERALKFYLKLKRTASKTRQFGAAELELCYVACGRIDAFEMRDLNAYDVAAGAVIVQEAGGKVTDFAGKPFILQSRDVLATNGRLHGGLLGTLKR